MLKTAFGIFFTPWLLDRSLQVAGAVTAAAIVALFLGFRSGRMSRGFLAAMALGYAAFVGTLVVLGPA